MTQVHALFFINLYDSHLPNGLPPSLETSYYILVANALIAHSSVPKTTVLLTPEQRGSTPSQAVNFAEKKV